MGSVLAILGANPEQTTVPVKCKLVVDEGAKKKGGSTFAGFVPVELEDIDVLAGKLAALQFAEMIVDKVTEDSHGRRFARKKNYIRCRRERRTDRSENAKKKVPKNFNPQLHKLRVAGVPENATDVGVHSSAHNESRDGLLSDAQVTAGTNLRLRQFSLLFSLLFTHVR